MNVILIKMFATALAMSQVTARPDKIKTEVRSQSRPPQVVQILRDGCTHMRKAFDIEDVNLDDLITTAMDDPKAIAGEIKAFTGSNSTTCSWPIASSARTRRSRTRRSISARSSRSTTRRWPTCPTTPG